VLHTIINDLYRFAGSINLLSKHTLNLRRSPVNYVGPLLAHLQISIYNKYTITP